MDDTTKTTHGAASGRVAHGGDNVETINVESMTAEQMDAMLASITTAKAAMAEKHAAEMAERRTAERTQALGAIAGLSMLGGINVTAISDGVYRVTIGDAASTAMPRNRAESTFAGRPDGGALSQHITAAERTARRAARSYAMTNGIKWIPNVTCKAWLAAFRANGNVRPIEALHAISASTTATA